MACTRHSKKRTECQEAFKAEVWKPKLAHSNISTTQVKQVKKSSEKANKKIQTDKKYNTEFRNSRNNAGNGSLGNNSDENMKDKNDEIEYKNHKNNRKNLKSQSKNENNNKLEVWYTNADVLTQEKLRELKEDIKSSNPPDIIAITEVKPKYYTRELSEVEYKIAGYSLEHDNLKEKDSTRGIAVYIRDTICYRIIDSKSAGKEASPKEILSLAIDLKNGEKLNLIVLYRSPNSDDKSNISINEVFKNSANSSYCHQVIVGDFNRKEIDWNSFTSPSPDDYSFIEAIRDSYLTQLIKYPTRGRGTDEPSTLDLVFTSRYEAVEKLQIDSPLGKSDHSLIKITYQYEAENLPTKVMFDYIKGDYEKMRQLLDVDWIEYLADSMGNIDLLWEKFHTKFKAAERECVPKKTVTIGKTKQPIALNRKSLSKRKKKYRLWKRYLESKDAEAYLHYCRARNQLRRMTRKAARDQEKKIASLVKHNSKAFWKYINSKTKLRQSVPDLFIDEKANVKTKSNVEKVEVLGKFFSSVFVKEPDWTWLLREEERPKIKNLLKIQITQEDLQKKLQALNPNKSPGPDGIHPKIFKETASVISEPLQMIFNESLKLGKLPSAWKEASITAIYKNKGDKHSATNYRPVSLTSVACKLMEKFIRDATLQFLQSNNILTNKQFGFIKGSSTTLQLLTIMDEWTEILERGGKIDVVYFDFQKAFDTVPHRRLIELMKHYQIENSVVTWISDFLTGRKQQVLVNGVKSSVFDVTSGVPQGSVLGPLLFLIYINLMVEKVHENGLYLFADDLKVFKEISSNDEEYELQQKLDHIYDWTQYSLLKFHPQKCYSMRLTLKKRSIDSAHYSIDDRRISGVSTTEDLGITFNDHLSFEEHINKKVNKANSLAGMIRRSFAYLDKDTFRSLFVSIVRPHLEYGATVWNPAQKHLIDIIENVQRRASKQVPGMSGLTYTERLKALDLPTLQYRRYRGDMIELYKLFHRCYDQHASKTIMESLRSNTPRQSSRNHPFTIYKVPCTKAVRRSSFKCRVTDQWNNLPAYVVEAPSVNAFKNRLDNLWKCEDIMYETEKNLHEITSSRKVRYQEV